MQTTFPGPETQRFFKENAMMSDNYLTALFPADLQNSVGNYIADADGNMYLDVFNNIACISLGYNHPAILEASKSELMATLVANRTGMGINPPKEYVKLLKEGFIDVAPKGVSRVGAMTCGTCAVEGAFKSAFMLYAAK